MIMMIICRTTSRIVVPVVFLVILSIVMTNLQISMKISMSSSVLDNNPFHLRDDPTIIDDNDDAGRKSSIIPSTTTVTTTTTAASAFASAAAAGGPCSGYDGVLHIRSGDYYADSATLLFTYVINHIIYAERHNLIPWVHFDEMRTNPSTYTNQTRTRGSRLLILMKKTQRLGPDEEFVFQKKKEKKGGKIVLKQISNGNLRLYKQDTGRILWTNGYNDNTTNSGNGTSSRYYYFTKLQVDCNLLTIKRHHHDQTETVVWASGSRRKQSHLDDSPCFLSYNSKGKAITVQTENNLVLWKDNAKEEEEAINPNSTATKINHIVNDNGNDDYFVADDVDIPLESKIVMKPIPIILGNNGSECRINNGHIRKQDDLWPIPGPPLSLEDIKTTNNSITGHGIWRSYFKPVVSAFDWDDPSCSELPVVQFPDDLVTTLHVCDPHSVFSWVYEMLPGNLRPKSSSTNSGGGGGRPAIHDWLGSMRERASKIVKKHYHLLPWLQSRIDVLVKSFGGEDCLAMHIRHTDKGAGRSKFTTQAFLPYAEAYVRAGGECIFLATDSDRTWSEIRRLWPDTVVRKIIVQDGVFRSNSDRPTFVQKDPARINTEILTEIYAMSKCSFLLHGFSAVSEAVIYLNPKLHNNSVNLDIQDAPSPEAFQRTISEMMMKKKVEDATI